MNSLDLSKLPNFFIIGAPKAGTTSLFNILETHPQVFGSNVKETGYFSKDDRYNKGLLWYQEAFFQDSQGFSVRMEATPTYLTWSEKTAKRIHDDYPVPNVKFAVIFRDPVQRAYSHYWHRVRLGQEPLSFEEAIRAESGRIADNYDELYRTGNGKYGYFRAGCYASRLKPFLEQFDKERFFFMLQEDLSPANFEKSIAKLQQFLGLEISTNLAVQKSNQATLPRKNWAVNVYWTLKRTFLSRIYRKSLGGDLRQSIHTLLFPPSAYPPLDEKFAKILRQSFAEETKELAQLIQRDLSAWYK